MIVTTEHRRQIIMTLKMNLTVQAALLVAPLAQALPVLLKTQIKNQVS